MKSITIETTSLFRLIEENNRLAAENSVNQSLLNASSALRSQAARLLQWITNLAATVESGKKAYTEAWLKRSLAQLQAEATKFVQFPPADR